MTVIADYGAGNLRSVQNTLDAIGADYIVTRNPDCVKRADKLILPGVGHFGHMMRALDELGLREPITERIRAGVPFLGICVGLQCLFEQSEEASGSRGLGLLPGSIKRFTGAARIPHMGWNSLSRTTECRLVQDLRDPLFVYFAHSYYAPLMSATAATCTYIHPYTAILEQDNVFAVQFHPEKSGPVGLQIVKNFLAR